MKTQAQELADAAKKKRQPICVYCEKPLDVVIQTQYDYIYWTWSDEEKMFMKTNGEGGADKPEHGGCGARDWDFIESGEATSILGLEY